MITRGGRVALFVEFALTAGKTRSATSPPEPPPEPVATTCKAMFPHATIQKLDAEEEEGIMAHGFGFLAGGRVKETDIATRGTMIESALVIPRNNIRAVAMRGILAAAKRAALRRCEWIETSHEPKAGKLVRLHKPMIQYAAESGKAVRLTEVMVTTDGDVVEAPDWLRVRPATSPQDKTSE